MNFSFYIAKRYLFSKSSNNAINIITGIAATGVVLGAMSLFIVLSGFSGLKDFSLQFTQVFDSDLKVYPSKGKTFNFSDKLENKIKNIDGIHAVSKTIEERVFLHYKGKSHVATIKGIDTNYNKVTVTDSILSWGNWLSPNQDEVVIGLGTSHKLSLGIMDFTNLLEIFVPKPGKGQILDPKDAFTMERAVVSGVYQINEDLDQKYIFSDIEFARSLLQLDSSKISSLEIKLNQNASENEVLKKLQTVFKEEVIIKNRMQQNDALYKMLNTENLAVYLIFTLVLIISLFNVIGSIIMMILDKKKNIKTLFNLGSPIKDIRKIFFFQGILLSVLGGVVGIFIGSLLVFLQLQLEWVMITSSLPYPVKFEIKTVFIVFFTITLLGIVASKIASSRVSEKLIY